MEPASWFVIERVYYIIEKGTLLACAPQTDLDFQVESGDVLEIQRPAGGPLRTRVADVCENASRPCGDLLVEGLRKGEIPAGSRARVVRRGGRRARHGPR